MPYKDTLKLSEISFRTLSNLKYFIEQILDLSKIYGDRIKIPVAYPPKKENAHSQISEYLSTSMSVFEMRAMPHLLDKPEENSIKGIYQDEAILKESAEARLDKVVLLTKLGGISSVSMNDAPLEKREMTLRLEPQNLKDLFNKIGKMEETRERELQKEEEREKKENEIYYDSKNSRLVLGEKTIDVSGWEEAVCIVFFSPHSETDEITVGDIIEEKMGEDVIYERSKNSPYQESVRQAVYRLNDKIKRNFGKKDYLRLSTKTRKLTQNTNK